jgi:hypothetical protein
MKWVPSFVVLLLASLVAAQPTRPAQPLNVDHTPGGGVRLTAGGVPVSRGSAVQLYAPGWAEGYYSSGGAKATGKRDASKNEWRIEHQAPAIGFDATETVRTFDGTRVDWTIAGTHKSDKPVRLEWALAHVNAFALYGGSYNTATTRPTPVLPETSKAGDADATVGGLKQVELDSPVGRLTFKVEEGDIRLGLIDGRKKPDSGWAQVAPTFWLGVTGAELRPNQPFKFRVSVTFSPKAPEAAAAEVTATVPAVATDRAFAARSGPVRVIPKPKSMRIEDGRFAIGPDTAIVIIEQGAASAARSLAREVKERFGWTWQIYGAERVRPTDHTILFAPPPAVGLLRPEGYWVDCRPNGLKITADDNAGYFYGAQTLAQLIRVEDDTVYVPSCRVDDYPSLAFRGVHLFPGKDAMPTHRRMIERVIARYKMNHVVLQSDYTRWQTDPKIWTDISVPKEQLAEYVRTARENQVEPIPLVMSLGHMEWMFKNQRNLDLAEDPETPYAYSVTNPKTYQFIHSVYDEALAIFGSKWLHIGHDEVAMRGRYPHRDVAKEWGPEKLFLYDANRQHDWLAAKDVGTMMWGDVLLSREESSDNAANADSAEQSARMREAIPKDTVICDWHYTPTDPANYKSLRVFRDAGFRTIACTWHTPNNIYTFAEAARLYGAWGLLQTTWAGYSITEKTLKDAPDQFAAYVLAAEYAWSADSPRPAELPWDAREVFAQSMNPAAAELGVRAGRVLNLSAVGGVEDATEDFLNLGDAVSLTRLYGDEPKSNHLFWSGDGGYPAVVLDGALLTGGKPRPATVTLRADSPVAARELAFLHATAFPAAPGEVVGAYEIVYADGSTVPVPLRYGEETRALTDVSSTSAAAAGWTGKSAAGVPAALRVLRVPNPNPTKPVAAVRFSTRHPYASPILFGVTMVE